MIKTCKQCKKEFEVTDDDLAFYKKISPIFVGKTYEIPAPTFCPDCRNIRRMFWRNERCLYKRRCDKTGKELISIYSPDKKDLVVWDKDEWFKDDWSLLDYGRDYKEGISFFEQFHKLLKEVPRPHISLFNVQDSDYCNFIWNAKNMYLCFAMMDSEDCLFSTRTFKSRNCADCTDVRNSEFCYECLDCERCYCCQQSERCKDCTNLLFSYDCRSCSDCFLCSNLRSKQFCIRNKQVTKEEYFKHLDESNLGSAENRKQYKEELAKLKKDSIQPATYNIKSENCTGDYLTECKNCTDSFLVKIAEDCKYLYSININIKNSYDMYQAGDLEWSYEGVGITGFKNQFNCWTMYGSDNLYSVYVDNCHNCFGCFGLKNKSYCILNKQYSKEEYEKLAAKIIEQMIKDKEWGEFYPTSMAPFCYNETVANIWYPRDRAEASRYGGWLDIDYSMQYAGIFYKPKDDIEKYRDDKLRQELLSSVIKCEKSGKAYRIMPQELAFYLEQNIPIPTRHYDVRYQERFGLRNPRVLYRRKCMSESCQNEFEATYAPDRPEKVYCEGCYQKAVL